MGRGDAIGGGAAGKRFDAVDGRPADAQRQYCYNNPYGDFYSNVYDDDTCAGQDAVQHPDIG